MQEALATGCAPVRLDRRIRRSRTRLRDALVAEIAATGDLSRVTVTAVTERAGLTRRTFYSHFHDIPELVDAIETEALADIRALVAGIVATNLDELAGALDALEPAPGAVELLEYFRDNAGHLTALLGQGGDPAFVEKIKAVCTDAVCARALDGIDLRALGPFFDYYLAFAVSAEVGVLTRWLTGGMREDVRTMAAHDDGPRLRAPWRPLRQKDRPRRAGLRAGPMRSSVAGNHADAPAPHDSKTAHAAQTKESDHD